MADFVAVATVDDFEEYTNDTHAGRAIFQTWTDGTGVAPGIAANGTGSLVGSIAEPFAGQTVVHSGRQAMPVVYNNVRPPWCSLVERTWATSQDWTIGGADTLTLYFYGEAENEPDRLFAGIEDTAGRIALISHPDGGAIAAAEWCKWHIPLGDLRAAGVDLCTIRKMYIGMGGLIHAPPGGRGTIHLDDIRLTRRMP
jgi:hypothetical protein